MMEVTAYRWVPPFAQGFVRDLRLRWALEECALPYRIRLIDFAEKETPAYKAWQPFGQVPAFRDGEIEMFESGAVVLYLAQRSEALAPVDPRGRARVTSWVVAALNSIEPFAQSFLACEGGVESGEAWAAERRKQTLAILEQRLGSLAAWLGDRDYLEDRFTAGDLMMTCVLRELVDSGVLARFPNLDSLRARCEARPAFARSLEAQLATFREYEPATV